MRPSRAGLPALLAFALLFAGCASGGGGPSSGLTVLSPEERATQLARWDQGRVTRIASELADAADGVQNALRNQPTPTVGSGQWASIYRLQQQVRRTRSEAHQLESLLKNGNGYEETLPVFEAMATLVNDCAENARKIFVQESVMEAIVSAGSLVNQLAPYYDPQAR